MADVWLILDVETTGLDPATAGVWQLGAVVWQAGATLAAWETLVRPEPEHWTAAHRARAQALSRLTPAEAAAVATSPGVESLGLTLWRLFSLLPPHPARIMATSYNLRFEQAFLTADPSLALAIRLRWQWGPCLMAAAVKNLAPERDRLSLEKACAGLAIPWTGAHRALADARLAAQVGQRLGLFGTGEGQP